MDKEKSKIGNLLKKFEDLSAIGIANLSGTLISSLFWLFLASIISTEEYGQISYYIAIGSIASIVSLVGGNTTITVYTAKKTPIVSTVFLVSIIASIISAVMVLIIVQNPVISAYVIAYVIFALTTSYYLGEKRFKKYSKIFLLQKVLFVILAIPLNYILGPNGVVLGIALSFLVPLYTFFRVFKEIKMDFPLLRSKAAFMRNSYGKDLARVASVQIDKIIVAPFFGFAVLGNYYLGLQFLSILTIVPMIMYQYTLTHDAIGESTRRLKKGVIGLSVIMAVLGITAAPQIFSMVFPKFGYASDIIQILSLAIIPRTISMMYSSELLGAEKSQTVLIGSVISLAVLIPLIFILGQYFGVNGVAAALVISEVSLVIFYFAKRLRLPLA